MFSSKNETVPVSATEKKSEALPISDKKKAPIHVNNVVNIIKQNDKDSILVDHSAEQMKFTFYDTNKNLLGSFTALQLIKFTINKYPTFLQHIEMGIANDIIKKYVCNINNDGKVILVSHFDSPFTGNVEMLVKLYTDITKCDVHISSELHKFVSKDAKIIQYIIKELHFTLLNHTLKIISSLTEILKDDDSKKNIRDNLLKYSVGIVYKITSIIRDDIHTKTLEYKSLQDDVVRLAKIKITMDEKMKTLYDIVEAQNTKIDDISANINNLHASATVSNGQIGGNDETTDSIESETDSSDTEDEEITKEKEKITTTNKTSLTSSSLLSSTSAFTTSQTESNEKTSNETDSDDENLSSSENESDSRSNFFESDL